MPSLELSESESLLLAYLRQEEDRLFQEIIRLQEEVKANREACYRAILVARKEPMGSSFKILADDKGRPSRLEWERNGQEKA